MKKETKKYISWLVSELFKIIGLAILCYILFRIGMILG